MRIIKLLYLKYCLSFLVCTISCFILFFIFSLLGNLNEDYLFKTIINLSLLNSLQILTYVPSFIFLLTVILFTIFLRSKNEMIIIRCYVNIKRIVSFFLPIVLIFTTLEIKKNEFVDLIENNKADLVNQSNKKMPKILINEESDSKTFIILNNINLAEIDNAEYRAYTINNNKIQLAQFSNNLILSNNTLIAKNYTQYKDNLIEDLNIQKELNINLLELNKQNSMVKNISIKSNYEIDMEFINLVIFNILFFSFVFLIFNNKKFVSIKVGLAMPILICFTFLLYSFFIFNNSLNFYKQEFEILASFIMVLLVLKESLNE